MKLTKRNEGVTLVELLMAVAVMGILVFMTGSFFTSTQMATRQASESVDVFVEKNVAEEVITRDLRWAHASFNILKLWKGQSGNTPSEFASFFDYYADIPCSENCTRAEHVMSAPASRASSDSNVAAEFYVLTVDEKNNYLSTRLNPSEIYERTTGKQLRLRAGALKKGLGDLYKNNQLLLFNSPNYVRREFGASNPATHQTTEQTAGQSVPVAAYFLARVSGDQVKLVSDETNWHSSYRLFWNYQPQCLASIDPIRNTASSNGTDVEVNLGGDLGKVTVLGGERQGFVKINTLESFFRCLPSVGGLASVADVMPVRLIRYRLVYDNVSSNRRKSNEKVAQAVRETPVYNLQREELGNDNAFTNAFPIAVNVKKVRFMRESVSSPTIYFRIEYGTGEGL